MTREQIVGLRTETGSPDCARHGSMERERVGPRRDGLEPLISRCTKNCDEPVALLVRVIEQDGVIGAAGRQGKILEASLIATAHVRLRYVVASGKHAIADSAQINLDILGSDVHQYNLKATGSRSEHHLQVTLARECSFDGEAFAFVDVSAGGVENRASRRHRRCSGNGWLKGFADRIGIKQRKLGEILCVPSGNRGLTWHQR